MKTAKEITKDIKSIQTRGQNLDASIQATACDVLIHIESHCEASLACKLFNAMPQGSRRSALVAFMVANGKVKVNDGKDKAKPRKEFPFLYDAHGTTFSASRASDKPWYDYKKETQSQIFDDKALIKQIKALQTKVQSAIKEGSLDEHTSYVDALVHINTNVSSEAKEVA